MQYLLAKVGHKDGVNVGIHIPAPWFAYGIHTRSFILTTFSPFSASVTILSVFGSVLLLLAAQVRTSLQRADLRDR